MVCLCKDIHTHMVESSQHPSRTLSPLAEHPEALSCLLLQLRREKYVYKHVCRFPYVFCLPGGSLPRGAGVGYDKAPRDAVNTPKAGRGPTGGQGCLHPPRDRLRLPQAMWPEIRCFPLRKSKPSPLPAWWRLQSSALEVGVRVSQTPKGSGVRLCEGFVAPAALLSPPRSRTGAALEPNGGNRSSSGPSKSAQVCGSGIRWRRAWLWPTALPDRVGFWCQVQPLPSPGRKMICLQRRGSRQTSIESFCGGWQDLAPWLLAPMPLPCTSTTLLEKRLYVLVCPAGELPPGHPLCSEDARLCCGFPLQASRQDFWSLKPKSFFFPPLKRVQSVPPTLFISGAPGTRKQTRRPL